MKKAPLEAVNRRFVNTEQEPLCAIVTVLDPRYKDRPRVRRDVFFGNAFAPVHISVVSLDDRNVSSPNIKTRAAAGCFSNTPCAVFVNLT
ncbi:putative zinc finger BED domain-containing protein 4-like [Scophthalmus maximus]|uniref:Putative zinc finger BED domain-containing protein 4-like n=1 Tax=Scophthalmus maximus TaxID=52904 RepID=A0A2U9BDE0_SCOMX|nr:putative zinc finger BED domain-containing protein 4-like [Scophthalmus maximus]